MLSKMPNSERKLLKSRHFIFLGNPGSGKSTIANTISPGQFEAGVNFGCGLTKIFKKFEMPNGDCFIDTPGLADVSLREQAAEEIKKALTSPTSEDGKVAEYSLVFVVQFTTGRLSPQDIVTINTVMDAIKDCPMVAYNLVLNQAHHKLWEKLMSKPDHQTNLARYMSESLNILPSTLGFILYEDAGNGEDNYQLNGGVNLCRFTRSGLLLDKEQMSIKDYLYELEPVTIQIEEVADLKIDDFKELQENYEALQAKLEQQTIDAKKVFNDFTQKLKISEDKRKNAIKRIEEKAIQDKKAMQAKFDKLAADERQRVAEHERQRIKMKREQEQQRQTMQAKIDKLAAAEQRRVAAEQQRIAAEQRRAAAAERAKHNWTYGHSHPSRRGRGLAGAHHECINKGCSWNDGASMWSSIHNSKCNMAYCTKCCKWQNGQSFKGKDIAGTKPGSTCS